MKKPKYFEYLHNLFKKDKTIIEDDEDLRGLPCHQRLFKKAYPLGFLSEIKALIRLAVPISMSSVFIYTISPVSMAFCGHLGKDQLAIIGLAMSVFNICGMFIILGLLTACDTLFSQTYGSTIKNKMVLQLYRAIILISLCCIPSCAFYLNAEPVLLLLGQNPLIAQGTANLLLYLIPALIFGALGQLLIKFIQTQNRVYPPLFIMILVNGINALMHYILIYVLGMDVSASAISQAIAYFFQVVCLIIYIRLADFSKIMSFTPTKEIWEDWDTWFRLAIPGLIMVSLEWTIYEIGGFIAGSLGARELGAQSIVITIGSLCYTLVPIGVGSATGIRVGQYLGAQSVRGPHCVFSVALTLVGLCSLPYLGILIAIRWHLPKIFTLDSGVIELVAELMPIISVFQIVDGVNGVCSGVLKGSGLQTVGAIVNIVFLYMIAAPLGVCLVYLANLRLKGIWIGLICAATIQVSTLCVICFNLNWSTQIKLALQRIKAENESSAIQSKSMGEHNVMTILNVEEGDILSKKRDELTEFTKGSDNSVRISNSHKKHLSKTIIRNRIIFILILLLLLASSILCRIFINWSDYFGVYCVYNNDTFIKITSLDSTENCTVIVP
uniref:Multidrug and toxin extrusion protein n=1 Tax=Trichobilharzia regenti TaxID=157069 RepID=A0AA85KDU2_TRIRE|nr:unnamed protein product [Trichobilharzia regenti]